MTTKVETPKPFLREVGQLAKKYPAVFAELDGLIEQLENDQRPGDKIPRVGRDVYKVRLPNPSAQRGKSGGFRVIYYVQLADSVLLVSIYSKTDRDDITPEEIRRILDDVLSSSADE